MSLSDLAALGSFVSGVAVLASLGFLFLQMRQMGQQMQQSALNQRAILMQQRMALGMDAMFRSAEPQNIALSVEVEMNPRSLSPTQLLQFFHTRQAFWLWIEDAHYHYTTGLFDSASFEPFLNHARGQLSVPYMRAFWYAFRTGFSPRFVEFIDGLLPTILLNPGSNLLQAGWNEALDRVEREMDAASN